MPLTVFLQRVFGYTTRWSLHAHGVALALLAPVVVTAVIDWRVRSRR